MTPDHVLLVSRGNLLGQRLDVPGTAIKLHGLLHVLPSRLNIVLIETGQSCGCCGFGAAYLLPRLLKTNLDIGQVGSPGMSLLEKFFGLAGLALRQGGFGLLEERLCRAQRLLNLCQALVQSPDSMVSRLEGSKTPAGFAQVPGLNHLIDIFKSRIQC